jgi:hypothetical protein
VLMCGSCEAHGGEINACKILVWKPEGKRQLVRPGIYRGIKVNLNLQQQDEIVLIKLICLSTGTRGVLLLMW